MQCRRSVVAFAVLAAFATLQADAIVQVRTVDEDASSANPIRKVVTLLQNMAKKVEKEADQAKELYEKFACYCSTGAADLQTAIADNQAKVPSVQSDIEEAVSKTARLELELKNHQTDRAAAKEAMKEASGIRAKEQAEYSKQSSELNGYVGALAKTISAIESGMSGSALLQTKAKAAAAVRQAAVASTEITDDDRQSVLAFLGEGAQAASSAGYVPKSGEITGILKEMKGNFDKDLAAVEKAEADAVAVFDELMAAKTKQVKTLSASIEKKTSRVGELKVEVVKMRMELSDSEASLIEDQKFLGDMDTNCAAKAKEHEEQAKTRSEELVAIHETIKILNDDDALDLFKKTLPSASLLQVNSGREQVQRRALALLQRVAEQAPNVRFLELALEGKKVDFSKVIKMIDDMVALLKQEQVDDDSKIEYCRLQLDQTEDRMKELSGTQKDLEVSIEERTGLIATLKDEIKTLNKGIVELDKQVSEATYQRKNENEEFTEAMSSNSAAKEVLAFAKNRLNKFYSPKLYKAPAKAEEADASFLQIAALRRDEPAPPPPTATYEKSTEESGGVVGMIDLLVRDIEKDMTESQKDEEFAQKSYEELMNDSASKRAKDLRSIEVKESSKADTEELLTKENGDLASTKKEFYAVGEYKQQLHAECDWILQNFDLRKEARTQEIENLKNAKAVLSGADFALLQAKVGFLTRHQ